MYCKVHHPVGTPGVSDNKGTCRQLVDYLRKEEEDERPYYDTFFSQVNDYVTADTVLRSIDNNHRTLKNRDDKFYMLTVNPDRHELGYLVCKVTGREVSEFSELTPEEQQMVIAELKVYARGCMDEYARNFYREHIRDGSDLVWFGRVETERRYKSEDEKDVKEGRAKVGDLKPGLQLHIHIIVSRMDRTQTVSLSPLARSRGNRQVLDGKEVVVGFDRNEWANRCAGLFNERYGYKPWYALPQSHGKNGRQIGMFGQRWSMRNRIQNKAVSSMKWQLLHGELQQERKMYANMVRTYRFIINPKRALLAELKQVGRHLLE